MLSRSASSGICNNNICWFKHQLCYPRKCDKDLEILHLNKSSRMINSSVAGPVCWNSLPDYLKSSDLSFNCFRQHDTVLCIISSISSAKLPCKERYKIYCVYFNHWLATENSSYAVIWGDWKQNRQTQRQTDRQRQTDIGTAIYCRSLPASYISWQLAETPIHHSQRPCGQLLCRALWLPCIRVGRPKGMEPAEGAFRGTRD